MKTEDAAMLAGCVKRVAADFAAKHAVKRSGVKNEYEFTEEDVERLIKWLNERRQYAKKP